MFLKRFLKFYLLKEVFAKPILVFSSHYTKASFGLRPIENVYVVQKNFLLTLFDGSNEYQYPVPGTS